MTPPGVNCKICKEPFMKGQHCAVIAYVEKGVPPDDLVHLTCAENALQNMARMN